MKKILTALALSLGLSSVTSAALAQDYDYWRYRYDADDYRGHRDYRDYRGDGDCRYGYGYRCYHRTYGYGRYYHRYYNYWRPAHRYCYRSWDGDWRCRWVR